MIQMTKIPGVPDRNKAVPGMAFYEGSGPVKTTCASCKYLVAADRRLRCQKFTELTGKIGPNIRGYYDACKYYEQT